MALSGPLFPAEDVFKYFTHTTTEDGRERKVDVIRAITNPCIRVAGRLKKDGTFVIHLAESIPAPTRIPKTAPKSYPIRWIAYLRDGMYVLYGLPRRGPTGEESGKAAFAGKPSEVWCQRGLDERPVWRVVFGRRRGRLGGSHLVTDDELRSKLPKAVQKLRRLGEYPSQPKVMAQMGQRGDPARAKEWVKRLGFDNWQDFLRSV
jgi:hypothetical protein